MDELSSMTYFGMAPGMRRKLQLAIMVLVALVLLGIANASLSGNRILLIASCVLALVVAPIVFGLVRQMRYTRLGIGESGLRIRGSFGKDELEFGWGAIERLHLDAQHQGIVMRSPVDHPALQGMVRGAQLRMQNASATEKPQAELVANQRWIPFESFAGWLEGGSVVEEFRRCGPELADDYDRVATEFAKVLERQRIVYVASFTIAIILILAMIVATFASRIVAPTGQAISWGNFLQLVSSITLSVVSLLLVPLLSYFASVNLFGALAEWKQKDVGAALTCIFLAIVQAGFAFWIASSIIKFATRT